MDLGDDRVNAGFELRRISIILRSYWRGILCIFVAVILIALLVVALQPRVYKSTSSGLVMAGGGEGIATALAADSLSKSKALGYMSIASTRSVAEIVRADLQLSTTEDALLEQITVSVPTNTSEIRISATAADPEAARTLADAWVDGLAKQIKNLEPESALGDTNAIELQPLGKAALPTSPVSPNTKLLLAVGGLVGIALGLGYALIRNRLDLRVGSAEALEGLGTSVIGTIPKEMRLVDGRAILEGTETNQHTRDSFAFAEALRELRTNLNYIDVDNPPSIMIVTSSVPAEGKSSVTANLAVAIASTGRQVVLIDADLRRPVQHKIFGLVGGVGLTDVLSHNAEIDDVMQPYGPLPVLQVIGAGRIPPNPSELLGSRSMKYLLEILSRDSIVLVDAPPLLPVTDAAILGTSSDGMLLVVKAGSTTTDEVAKAISNIKKVNAKLLGSILNQVPMKGLGATQYGYYGTYYSQDQQESLPAGDELQPAVSTSQRGRRFRPRKHNR